MINVLISGFFMMFLLLGVLFGGGLRSVILVGILAEIIAIVLTIAAYIFYNYAKAIEDTEYEAVIASM